MIKDYYLILGIGRNASLDGIKQAYRKSVKKYHPDLNKSSSHLEQFCDITEAYETLCNVGKRRAYDDQLRKEENSTFRHQPKPPQKENSSPYRYRRREFNETDRKPETLSRHRHSNYQFQIDPRDLRCSIVLTSDQQKRGAAFEHTILLQRPCSHCGDFFLGAIIRCPYCQGARQIQSKKELIINIPAGIDHGTLVRLPLDHIGLANMKLTVQVSVRG